jgi:hypothetical protein
MECTKVIHSRGFMTLIILPYQIWESDIVFTKKEMKRVSSPVQLVSNVLETSETTTVSNLPLDHLVIRLCNTYM